MKMRTLRVKVVEEADAATLQVSVQDFLSSAIGVKAAKEREFVELHALQTATGYAVLILYTE